MIEGLYTAAARCVAGVVCLLFRPVNATNSINKQGIPLVVVG